MASRREESTFKLYTWSILLVVFGCASFYLILNAYYTLGSVSIIIPLLCFYKVVNIHKKTLNKVALMFDAIENNDYSLRFSDKNHTKSKDALLNHYLNRTKELIISAREKVIESEKYFEYILNQINTGILVISDEGLVIRVNSYALNLFSLTILSHIKQLEPISSEIVDLLLNTKDGKSSQVKFYNESELVRLNLRVTELNLQKRTLKIITITDIIEDIDRAEIDSWSRMSRIFTHEIMNSLAPITAISESLTESQDLEYIYKGIEIIRNTSKRLTTFVESYKSLTKIPYPNLEEVDMAQLIQKEVNLIDQSIKINVNPGSYIVLADRLQISQVINNLLKNAKDATKSDAHLRVWVNIGLNANGKISIEVCNNGAEISDQMREDIFVPFFTTKEDGTGIGLSLSKQIMRQHNGSINLSTKPHTCFRVSFA